MYVRMYVYMYLDMYVCIMYVCMYYLYRNDDSGPIVYCSICLV